METYRLKNIAIVILLLLNACLLFMVGEQYYQSGQAERRAAVQLRELYMNSQLTLSSGADLAQQPLRDLFLVRQSDLEQSIASELLGGETLFTSQGGGINNYEFQERIIQFRAGGSFYGSHIDRPLENIPVFVENFCERFGYASPELQLDEKGNGSVIAGQLAGEVPVTNCAVEMYFEEGKLASVTGAHVSLQDAYDGPGAEMTCITALVRFLDYRNAAGVVCSRVSGVRCVYQLQSGSTPRLLPVWEIETDTYAYYVDCETGEVYAQ